MQVPLKRVLKDLEITDWDFLIVGDGSGSNWDKPCGWGAVSIERATMERRAWSGAMDQGTVNVAELMAYMQPLTWIEAREAERKSKRGARTRAYQIHIVTDSQYCAQTGSSANRMLAKNRSLWSVFDAYTRQGLLLNWHWLARNELGLNSYADRLSKLARLCIQEYNPQRKLERTSIGEVTIEDINP